MTHNYETMPKRAEHDFADHGGNRLFLFAMRRMAAAGVKDAHAANALLGHFGKNYRRPLVLMRAMMLELARASQRRIQVAPCCCTRLTPDEAMLMEAIGDALPRPRFAHRQLSALLDSADALGALTCAQAVAQCFTDLGRPLSLYSAG